MGLHENVKTGKFRVSVLAHALGTFADSTGDEIVNSDGPQGNIGYPITEKECSYFMTMMEQSKQRLTSQQTSDLATALDAYAAPKRCGND